MDMPKNPERAARGGDVEGTKRIDVTMGEALDVAAASFDPGYPIDGSLPDTTTADLIRGYSDSGRSIGEGKR